MVVKLRGATAVIVAVKDSLPVTEEELKMALLVMSSVDYFRHKYLRDLVKAVDGKNEVVIAIGLSAAKQSEETLFAAMKNDPLVWLGTNIPGNPEYEENMRMYKRIAKNATGIEL